VLSVPSVAKSSFASETGTVILVSLCFVAVLGIMLAGYLAVCSRVMTLSNRGFQTDLSKQLAEAGIEEALRAFNKNDWSDWTSAGMDVNWTVDTTNKRATATLSYPSGKFGQGVTAQVKIRVDNYDAFNLAATWTSGASYSIDDLVGRSGVWYRCLAAHTAGASNEPPNLNFWAPEGMPWKWVANTPYAVEDLVNVSGTWYRCTTAHTSPATFSTTNWETIYALYLSAPAYPYVPSGQKAYYNSGSSWTEFTYQTWGSGTPPVAWRWRADPTTYEANDYIVWNGDWYRCVTAHTNGTWATSMWNSSQAVWREVKSFWAWSSATSYNRGDVATRGGVWYRCIRAHSNQQPPNTAYWSDAPLGTNDWVSGKTYAANSVVEFNGTWFRNTSSTSNQPPNSPWSSAATQTWSPATAYSAGDYASYGGVWYRCLVSHTNQTPNNSTYWTAVGAPVIYGEGSVSLAGEPAARTQLRALVDVAPLLPNAIAASQTASFVTSGTVDSYDASISGSTYAAQVGTSTNYAAVIAGGNTSDNAVVMSGALTTSGFVAAPPQSSTPFAPRFSYSTSAVVKSSTSSPTPKVDPNRVSRSPYIPDFSILTPPAGQQLVLSAGSNTYVGVPGATTPSYYYYTGTLSLSSHTLNILGPVILNVSGGLWTQSNGRILIHASGSAVIRFSTSSAQLFIGDNGSSTPNAGIENLTLDPSKCVLVSTNTYNSSSYHYFWQRRDFYGVIYMPNAYLHLWNSGYSPNIYGAISAKNVYFNHAANLHYDTSLRTKSINGVEQPYTVTRWRELEGSELLTMP
jgi:hypothetical protein